MIERFSSWRSTLFVVGATCASSFFVLATVYCVSVKQFKTAALHASGTFIALLCLALLARVLRVNDLEYFETDGVTWIRVQRAGADFRVTQDDIQSLEDDGNALRVHARTGTFLLSPDNRGYRRLRNLLESWQQSGKR